MKPDINISSINENSTLSNNSQIIAKALNNYFMSVAQNILVDDLNNANISSNNNNPLSYLSFAFNQPFPNINLKYVSTKEIEDKTNSLKTKYSLGYNGIPTKVLKLSIPYISSILTYTCNRMTSSANSSMKLKFSEIKLIFKKGDKGNISNYRPISMLTSFSKIFKKAIFSRFYHNNNIIINEQFGFRKGSSTELASYNLIKNILSALNSISLVGGVFCDLQKAFDCINHDILLSKMKYYGISGKANNLITSNLHDRFKSIDRL